MQLWTQSINALVELQIPVAVPSKIDDEEWIQSQIQGNMCPQWHYQSWWQRIRNILPQNGYRDPSSCQVGALSHRVLIVDYDRKIKPYERKMIVEPISGSHNEKDLQGNLQCDFRRGKVG